MTSRRLGVAVIGADPTERGFGGRAHVPAVHAAAGLQLSAVCTAHEKTARLAAERWHAPRWYADYREAVADRDVDLVTVAVRVRLHRPIVMAALEEGKAVYCEWPLGLDAAEAGQLARLARERGASVALGTQGRFAPAVATARRCVERGDIGRPLSFVATHLLPPFDVHSDRWWLAREDEASGALQVATAHTVDTLQSVLGPVAALAGVRGTLLPTGRYVDTGEPFTWTAADTVAFVARLESGVLGSVHVANVARPAVGFALRILGDEGQLLVTAPGYVSFTPARVSRGGREDDGLETVPETGESQPVSLPDTHPGANVCRALSAFASAVTAERRFRPDFEDALMLHRILDAVRRSADDGVWVELSDA